MIATEGDTVVEWSDDGPQRGRQWLSGQMMAPREGDTVAEWSDDGPQRGRHSG